MLEITNTIDIHTINSKKNHYTQAINFYFDNGFKDNPKFSGKLFGIIFKDLESNLILQTITNNKESKKKHSAYSNKVF